MRVDQVTEAACQHAEGPVWSPVWGGLAWVDLGAGDVMRLSDPGVERWHVDVVAALLRPRASGGVVIAGERSFLAAPGFGGPLSTLATAFDDDEVRFNEGCCDPEGNLWCGTMRYDEALGGGTLYRLSADLVVEPVLREVTVSNGLAWSPDGGLAYYADTATGRVDVLRHEPGLGLYHRRPFVHVGGADGAPDGVTVDAEGGVWVALWGGGAVHRYDHRGRLSAVVELPVPAVTACTFGGPDLDSLFITTSRLLGAGEDDKRAGAVFRVEPGVSGLPVAAFAG